MKKICILAAFVLSLFGADDAWLNKWSKGESDEAKSVDYYEQNRGEARKVLQGCERKMLEFMEQLSINELEKMLKSSEFEVGVFALKKLGATFVMDCENAEKALGVTLFEDEVKSVDYYEQNRGEARKVAQECEKKLLKFMEQLSEDEVEKMAKGGEEMAAAILLKKLGFVFVMKCDNAEKALGESSFE